MLSKGLRLSFLPLLSLALVCTGMAGLAQPVQAGQGQWTPVGPGKAGVTENFRFVAVDAAAPGAVWASLPLGGLYRSIDHGRTWQWAGRPFAGRWAPRAIAAHPTEAGVLWAAIREGVFQTTDAGAHWTLLSGEVFTASLDTDEEPAALWAVPGTPPAFYVSTSQRQLLASFDGGQSWQNLRSEAEEVAVVPTGPATLYAAGSRPEGGSTLAASTDGGRSWAPLTSCPALATGIERIAASRDALYVLPIEDERLGLLRSRDGGRTWQSVLGGRPDRPFVVWGVRVDPGSPRTVWAIGGPRTEVQDEISLWVSRDGGTRWRRRTLPSLFWGIAGLAFGPGAVYAWSADELALSVDDGRTWSTAVRLPWSEGPPSRLAFQPDAPQRLTFVNGGRMYESGDGGRSWRWMEVETPPTFPPLVNDVWIDPARPGRMVAVSYGDAVVTNDHGSSWTRRPGPDAELVVGGGGRTLFAGGFGVYRSRDGGRTWRSVMPRSFTGVVQKIEVDPARPREVYVLAFEDPDFYPNHGPYHELPPQLWRSRDGGATWRLVARTIDAIALDRETSRLYAARETELLVSDNGGDTWQALPPLPAEVTDLAVPTGLPDTVYAAAADGRALLRSLDGGRTWETFGQGIPPDRYLLAIHPTDRRTVYALSREGIFHMKLPEP